MTFQEDTVLQVFKEYLESKGYFVLSASGKQQGLYRYNIGAARKGPDIVAVKDGEILIGEGKRRSVDLFKKDKRGISDYNSLQFALDNLDAQRQLLECIPRNINALIGDNFSFNACVVGASTYKNCLKKLSDKRISAFLVLMDGGLVMQVKNEV